MARATIQFEQVTTTRDLARFLDLLALVGIDTHGTDHPVRLTNGSGSAPTLSASLSVDDLNLSLNAEDV